MPDTSLPADRIRPYDMSADTGAASMRLPQLEAIFEKVNDRFCGSLRAALQQRLRRTVEIAPAPLELQKHRDLMARLATPSLLTMIAIPPWPGNALVVSDAGLVATMVESRFGGNGRFPTSKTRQSFSAFEQKTMRRVIETTLAAFALAWEPFRPIEPEIVRSETKPLFAAFAAPADFVVLAAYGITVGLGSGRLVIALPCTMIEPVFEGPAAGAVAELPARDPHWCDALRSTVAQAAITLNVELAAIDISVAELMNLAPGNIFELQRPEAVIVKAGGVPLFRGRWGRYGGKVAVSVEERLSLPTDMVA